MPVAPDLPARWGSYFGGSPPDRTLTPEPISLPGDVVQVATSNSSEYALLKNGQVYAWGLGTNGQLGDGSATNSLSVPMEVRFPPGVDIVDLPSDAMPFDTAMAVDSKGNVWGWGLNPQGQLCLGTTTRYLAPVKLPFTDVTSLAGAGDHAVYESAGTVYSCGGNHNGDLGDGNGKNQPSTVPVAVPGLTDYIVTELVASFNNSGALLNNGAYLDWGLDRQGQLGDGAIGRDSPVPVLVRLPLGVTQVAEGGSWTNNGQTIVMLSDGSLRAWGDDQSGQLGNGITGVEREPVEISPPSGVTYRLLASGGSTSYAVSTTGAVYGWGDNGAGQLGDGGTATHLEPTLVESGAGEISATAQNVVVGAQQ